MSNPNSKTPKETDPPFQIGKPIPKVWLHMEFTLADTVAYMNGQVVESAGELERLNNKYLGAKNE